MLLLPPPSIQVCVLLMLFAALIASVQEEIPLAGNSHVYREAIQLLNDRFHHDTQSLFESFPASSGPRSDPAAATMFRQFLQLLGDPDWSAVDANRLMVHVGCAQSRWYWPEVYPFVSRAFSEHLWPAALALVQDPQQFHMHGYSLHLQYPDLSDEILEQTLVLDYPQPDTGLTLIQRALEDQNALLVARFVSAGSIVYVANAKQIAKLLESQHLPLVPSLEAALHSLESNQDDFVTDLFPTYDHEPLQSPDSAMADDLLGFPLPFDSPEESIVDFEQILKDTQSEINESEHSVATPQESRKRLRDRKAPEEMDPCQCGKSKKPSFGFRGSSPVACKNCKKAGMIHFNRRTCPCGNALAYGVPNGKATACRDCKADGMIFLSSHRKCVCGKFPSFAMPGEKAIACKTCKTAGMINVVVKNCPCGKKASFGFPGGDHVACIDCKTDGMVDQVYKRCPCGKLAVFGIPGGRPVACKACKAEGMVNVAATQRCVCGKIPSFGVPGGRPVACRHCKTDGMVNVVGRKCACKKKASYGLPGGKRVACSSCKTDDMVDLGNRQCPCGKRPSFGFPGDKATACQGCKLEGMTAVHKYRKCPCGKFPSFGYPNGGKLVACKTCKTEDMVNIKLCGRKCRAACLRSVNTIVQDSVPMGQQDKNPALSVARPEIAC